MVMSAQELAEDLVRSAGGGDPETVLAGRPVTVENSVGEQIPVRPEHVLVWTHLLDNGPEKFDHAVGKVLPNGTLLIMKPGSDVPLKGYAPGAWLTFEHVGAQYHVKPQPIVPARGKIERVQPAEYRDGGYAADPIRRTPPTLDQDADEDTQSLPKVAANPDEQGGGEAGPKAPGARADAGRTGRTSRPATADLGIPAPLSDLTESRPGWFRSLWKSLTDPDWAED